MIDKRVDKAQRRFAVVEAVGIEERDDGSEDWGRAGGPSMDVSQLCSRISNFEFRISNFEFRNFLGFRHSVSPPSPSHPLFSSRLTYPSTCSKDPLMAINYERISNKERGKK